MFTAGSFSVNPAGAANYTVPIQVPPSAAGVEPKLALVYNSKAGNGLLGVGWALNGLSSIVRCPRTVAQDGAKAGVTYTNADRFCLDGQRLIAVSGTYGENGTEYRTELDAFAKIVSYTGTVCKTSSGTSWATTLCLADIVSFKVWTRSGQIREYGNTADSRIEAYDGGTVRVWALNKIQDVKGNYLTVTYAEDSPNGDFYPRRIDYTGNANTTTTPNNSVHFQYEARPDITPLYQGALTQHWLKINNVVRLNRVQTYNGATLVKDYQLQYGVSSQTSRSVLNAIKECEGVSGSCLPATSFTWDYQSRQFSNARWETQAGGFWNTQQWFAADVNGDGRMDLVNVFAENGLVSIDVHISTGSAFQVQRWITQAGAYGEGQKMFVADVNGDGRTDLINVYNDAGFASTNVYMSTGANFQMQLWEKQAGAYEDNQKWMVGDVNGDGRADLINVFNDEGYSSVDVHLNMGTAYKAQRWETRSGPTSVADKWFVGDADADGKEDVIQISNDNGDATTRVHLSSAGAFSSSIWEYRAGGMWEGQQWFVADVNGDGRTDLINVFDEGGGATIDVHIGSGGNFRSQRWETRGGTFKTGAQSLFVADVNGDGRLDLVNVFNDSGLASIDVHKNTGNGFLSERWETQAGNYWSGQKWLIADTSGEGVAHPVNVFDDSGLASIDVHNSAALADRIVTFTNGIGQKTAVTYSPLTQSAVYTKEADAVYPIQDMQAPLYVVSSVVSSNGKGGTTTMNYAYGGLKKDLDGRGVLGFRWMQATQAETGIVERTEYRQDWPYVGFPSLIRKTLAGAGNAGLLSQMTNTYSCKDFVGSPCTVKPDRRYFPFMNQSIEERWDLNGAVLPVMKMASQYDDYGNPTQVMVSHSDGFSKTFTNTYTNDTAHWFLGRLVRTAVTSTTP